MKKAERTYEKYSIQKPQEGFFRLTIFKAFLFGLIFILFVYYIIPGSLIQGWEQRLINAMLWLGSVAFIYLFSCSIAWVFRKARR